jgi:acyl carrier protein
LPRPAGDTPAGDGRLLEDVRAIWSEVLGAERIGLDDDLFDLGGHSLTITQIATRMRRRLRLDLPLQVFYDTPTIRGVVAAAGRNDG